jgi:multidrug efflux pump subunit AcrB
MGLKQKTRVMYKTDGQDRLLPRISLAIYDHARWAALLWILLAVFGIVSYTTLLKREGFPSVSIPFTVIGGTYLVNDPAKVDREIAQPVSEIALADDRVKSVQANARPMGFSVVVQYKDGTDADQAARDIEGRIKDSGRVPRQAAFVVESPRFGFTERGDDAVLSVYDASGQTNIRQLTDEASRLSQEIKDRDFEGVEAVSPIAPFVNGTDPRSGRPVQTQTIFDRYGERRDGNNEFHPSVAVGIMQREGSDVINVNDSLQTVVDDYNARQAPGGYRAVVSASYASDIKEQVGELQKALLEGLLAVLAVGSLIIAWRASIITVLSMLTVLAITAAVLFVVGYSLNTITLFALILCLGLIVDDTIIMVEALDAQRRRLRDARAIVRIATRKVSRAMVAATLTAALSFAPLLFVGGILGGFIRAIPVTVITSLLVSLVVALVFIPLFARYLLLGKGQTGARNVHEPAARTEAAIARFIARPMLWAKHSWKRLFTVGLTAVFIGLAFIGAGGWLFQKVTFNIFPPSKDTNGLTMQLRFAPGTDIARAQAVADRADRIVADTLGENFRSASYYANAGESQARMVINITPYDERDAKAPELETKLQAAFRNFPGAQVDVGLLDVGPPPSDFTVRIASADRQKSLDLADDIAAYLDGLKLERRSGETAQVIDITRADPGTYSRADDQPFVSVTAGFDAKDTTTLVTLAQDALRKEFNAERLRDYGLSADTLRFDLGQEQDNQDSFKSLAIAFPVLLFVIYLLLALQFRSLLQPLLIFLAIPFSLFGITLGLYLTENAFSFFAMLGFFALIGLSIKNTILLTDYANQLRREGVSAVDAAVGALAERFRPLIATSLTAVVSLIPLAVTSPFWEGLAVVLIGGLLSSTFLVITVFPYYYLGAEFLRTWTRGLRRRRRG